MDGQGEFEFEVTTRNTGSFEWTLTTDHDEDAYENWDNLWADIEMEVEEQVGSRWEDELDPGYGGHNPGFGDGFEVTLELTEEGAKEHGVEQEYAWVDWTASSSSPWYSAEGAETETFESPVSCKICGKTFDSFRGLNGHMNAHPLRWTGLSASASNRFLGSPGSLSTCSSRLSGQLAPRSAAFDRW